MPNTKISAGDVYGDLTVVKRISPIGNTRRVRWSCKCSCGRIAVKDSHRLMYFGKPSGCSGMCKVCSAKSVANSHRKPTVGVLVKRLYGLHIATAKHRGIKFNLTLSDMTSLVLGRCHYCGDVGARTFRQRGKVLGELECNGVDRLDSSRGYESGNVVSCCPKCNYMKYTMGYAEFISQIIKVHTYLKLGVGYDLS